MPKALQYRAGSVIYFQGDVADKIFILQSGKISLNYQDIETGQDNHDPVQPGEFFGVKSAMGRYPREETALVLQDAAVIAFTVPEFEQLATTNIRIVMKMLKVFSNQLRRIHKQVSNLMEKEEQQSPEIGLYMVGEYYLKNRQYAQAKYVFSRYLTYYPAGKMAPQAAKNLEIAETSLVRYGDGKGPAPIPDRPFLSGSAGAGVIGSTGIGSTSMNAAMGDTGAKQSSEELSVVAKAYYDAVSLFSQDKYPQAFAGFKKIVEANQDPEYVAKSVYEIGRCLFLMGKFDECLKHFTTMITTYPKHPDLGNALYFMAQCYEKKGDKDRAATFYKKILSMNEDEDDTVHLKAKKALKALEA
ncbi:cyclic nucleotide-binding domain-containing protein [Gracilinema caldarium]|uniref:Transcriptional regulator, Crp/Fnr family n=1 Tax=Gracilinema caldarium (strain ATCC 51460 / DSM 7334 / H1) TaxID=744872 RepID=F8EYY0_GRAC1|nr:cyclic nucleotide-binding domain-containing protein [Gracilinema caldarium]AEJ18926.1 putative transcriptional regulator, Crp/Fnr family [Gracilinema caldarium DSM 7334]